MKLQKFIFSLKKIVNETISIVEKMFLFLKDLIKDVSNYIEISIKDKIEPSLEDNLIKQNRLLFYESIVAILASRQKNKYYPANPSLWIVFISSFLGILILIFVSILHSQNYIGVVYKQFFVAIIGSIICVIFWVATFYKEKMYGYHTDIIRRSIFLGFWVFLFTEGLCFISLFWTFFHSLLAASTHIGQFSPGEGVVNYYLDEAVIMHPSWNLFYYSENPKVKLINLRTEPVCFQSFDHTLSMRVHFNIYDKGQLINPYGYPALNTGLLLMSAAILNASHVKLKLRRFFFSFSLLTLTIFIGIIFLCIQFIEIKNCTLQYNDGVYACSFYSLTGLHGIHVVLGVFALIICLINFYYGNYTRKRHDTYWCAIAYWHFVDIVWVLVYILIYCWSSCFYFSENIKYSYLGYKDYCLNINVPVFEKYMRMQGKKLECEVLYLMLELYYDLKNKKLEKKRGNIHFFERRLCRVIRILERFFKRFEEPQMFYIFKQPFATNYMRYVEVYQKKKNFLYFSNRDELDASFSSKMSKMSSEGKNVLKSKNFINAVISKHPEKIIKSMAISNYNEMYKPIIIDINRVFPIIACYNINYILGDARTAARISISKIPKPGLANSLIMAYNINIINLEKENDRKKTLRDFKCNFSFLYNEMYENRKYINYSEMKKSKHFHAVTLNILHFIAFDYLVDQWIYDDFTSWKGLLKFIILFILYNVNINWAFSFCSRFMPYLLQSEFREIWGDLLYTRKPKWRIKKAID